ncbi:MAG: alpha/beta hydrolase [Planctomycetaceae bacterium]|nr:alpha/beta hydrolase [Planctomycetaceae bacterium]
MQRHFFQSGTTRLSYLDSEIEAPLLVALHALWMQGTSFRALAARLFPRYRVVALDQRGHGKSERSTDYSRNAFVEDIGHLLDHLKVEQPVVLLGNSLGGTNAFQFAARYPERVSHLINEEGPAVENYEFPWMQAWKGVFKLRQDFGKQVGRFYWSLADSLVEVDGGWQLEFSVDDIQEVQRCTNGDWWSDWLATEMPALVVCGRNSRAVEASIMEQMALRRKNTILTTLEAGHVMHEDNVAATAQAIESFLNPQIGS